MAEKPAEKVLERTYNVPLRKEFLKTAPYKRAKRAVNTLRDFLKRHMKAEKVSVSNYLNNKLWSHGIKRPPHHIKVTATKDKDGNVVASMVGEPKPAAKKTKARKREEKGTAVQEALKKVMPAKPGGAKAEVKKEGKPVEETKAEPEKKEQIKEVKKEAPAPSMKSAEKREAQDTQDK